MRYSESPLAASLLCAAALFCLQVSIPTWWTVVAEISGRHGAAMFGLMNGMGGLGVMVLNVLVGTADRRRQSRGHAAGRMLAARVRRRRDRPVDWARSAGCWSMRRGRSCRGLRRTSLNFRNPATHFQSSSVMPPMTPAHTELTRRSALGVARRLGTGNRRLSAGSRPRPKQPARSRRR